MFNPIDPVPCSPNEMLDVVLRSVRICTKYWSRQAKDFVRICDENRTTWHQKPEDVSRMLEYFNKVTK